MDRDTWAGTDSAKDRLPRWDGDREVFTDRRTIGGARMVLAGGPRTQHLGWNAKWVEPFSRRKNRDPDAARRIGERQCRCTRHRSRRDYLGFDNDRNQSD